MSKTYLTELSEQDRKSIEEGTKMLSSMLRNCELYLKDYTAGKQTAFKFINTMRWVHDEAEELIDLIAEKHEAPGFRGLQTLSDSRWGKIAGDDRAHKESE